MSGNTAESVLIYLKCRQKYHHVCWLEYTRDHDIGISGLNMPVLERKHPYSDSKIHLCSFSVHYLDDNK